MANAIKIKRSGIQNNIPGFDDFEIGELAYNYYDGRLFGRTFDGSTDSIVAIGEQEQLGIPRLSFDTVALAEADIFYSGEVCFVVETTLLYWYDPNSSETRNGISVLNTGGSGRLLAIPTGLASKYLIKTTNYTISNNDPKTIDGDTNGGSIIVTLTASPLDGIHREIKNIGSNGNDLTIARNGRTIDGLNEDLILRDKDSASLQYTTVGWQIR
jgi:hypothetical protein